MTALHVLHIDDEPDIREIIALSLGLDPEIAVRSYASGEEGLAAAAEDPPDLILLDAVMPVMSGPTILARLRAAPRTAAIPVIFMTARAQRREIEEFKSLGAAGVIVKPFDPMTLAAVLRSYAAPNALAASDHLLLEHVADDVVSLNRCLLALAEGTASTEEFIRIREIAHGLAGSGGVFGFPEISAAAAILEHVTINHLEGADARQNVERALEQVLSSIGPAAGLEDEPARRRVGS